MSYEAMLVDVTEPREVNDPPMYNVPFDDEFDQQIALMTPPVSVLPRGVKVPSDALAIRVSPVVENFALVDDDEAKEEESDHQSSPENAPPIPTDPIREKSTWGREAGADVAAMAGRARLRT